MMDDRTKMLIGTIQKLYNRGAKQNIQRILSRTHKADIAEMLENFAPQERLDIFSMEASLEKRAAVLSYLNPDLQKEMLDVLGREEVLKLVSLMEPDDAADLLGYLPEEDANDILNSMRKEDKEEVADLMAYPEDSAGGLMSSDFFALDQHLTVSEVIKTLQAEEDSTSVAFYIYVTNDNDQLIGVVSLKQLLLSKSNDCLKDIMYPDVISASVEMDQEQVAQLVERYDFLSLPVVESNNKLVGVITVDDVIDVIREEAEEDLLSMGQAGFEFDASIVEHFKARFPWLLLAFLGGTFCFVIVYFFGFVGKNQTETLWFVAAILPLLLAISGTTGSQAATVSIGAVRANYFDKHSWVVHMRKEISLGIIFGILFSGLVYFCGHWFYSDFKLAHVFSLVFLIQIVVAVVLGTLIPIFLNKMNVEPTIASVPLFTAIADLSAVSVLFGIYHA